MPSNPHRRPHRAARRQRVHPRQGAALGRRDQDIPDRRRKAGEVRGRVADVDVKVTPGAAITAEVEIDARSLLLPGRGAPLGQSHTPTFDDSPSALEIRSLRGARESWSSVPQREGAPQADDAAGVPPRGPDFFGRRFDQRRCCRGRTGPAPHLVRRPHRDRRRARLSQRRRPATSSSAASPSPDSTPTPRPATSPSKAGPSARSWAPRRETCGSRSSRVSRPTLLPGRSLRAGHRSPRARKSASTPRRAT